ncbi:Transcriptional regulator, TetR family [Arthrobacter sp. 9AX]|uniref:TetR family transcriptional regulator n=1 Tax=Arthrobacter sp. 9AX TaxID=2653131 RepID=UPI0012EFA22C|nr:TetR family transcriptional regulator [Arthrobacter sp. 9AX]VXB05607.1 Transcriptional regulator, TetR family [Arthrobacter sp. 9AX]
MTRSAFLRARRPEQKQQRREAILHAARNLATGSGVRNVSLGAVADAVGLAKSNISRYYGTREEIYLELLTEEWQRCAQTLTARLEHAHGTEAAVTALAATMTERPLFCDLLSHLPTSLELNISVAAARTFKHVMHDHFAAIGAALAGATGLTESEGSELVAAGAGMAGLLYRAANPPSVLAQVYAQDPELAATRPALQPALVRMLMALAAGLPTLRHAHEGRGG